MILLKANSFTKPSAYSNIVLPYPYKDDNVFIGPFLKQTMKSPLFDIFFKILQNNIHIIKIIFVLVMENWED